MTGRLAILGAGESGTGAARLGKRKDWDVFVSDLGAIGESHRKVLQREEIAFEQEQHTADQILNADLIVKSPGIPDSAPLVVEAREKGVPVISEIEFASRYSKAHITAITGSNGKTTTTSLTGAVLKQAGLDVEVGGNIGRSFANILLDRDPEYAVLELSSFQLDGMLDFRPRIAMLLNITPDHLDRYEYSLDLYAASKMSIAANQTEADHFIYCAEDPITSEKVAAALSEKNLHAQLHPFGFDSGLVPNQAAWLAEDQLHIDIKTTPSSTQPFSMSIYELALQGKHNLYNSMAAGIAGRILDITHDDIRNAMTDFRALEHRLQSLGEVQKIEFINDSKATNVNSTWYALESIQKPLIWIVGGVDKGNDYTELVEMVSTKVKAIVCLGLDNRKLHEAFARHVDLMVNCRSMPEAVRMAYHLGDAGDAVLLSPACASFDLFESYEDRGNRFKQAFLSL